MARTISVKLEVHQETLRRTFQQILRGQADFVIQEPDDPAPPYLLILDLEEGDPSETFMRIESLLASSPAPEIFLTAARIDPDILLKALRAGVKEFFRQPIDSEEVAEALERMRRRSRRLPGRGPGKKGTLFCVVGGKGGIGTTTVAVNLGSAVQKLSGRPSVALVDLNGDLPLFLDLEPARSFRDIASAPSRLDRTFLLSVLSRHPSGLSVLPLGEDDPAEGNEWLGADCVDQTLELLQELFDYVVIDCGAALEPRTMRALTRSSSILVISTLSVPVIRRTRKLLSRIPGDGGASRIKVIMNRYAPHGEALLKETEEVLQRKVYWQIPNDYYIASTAINTGQPLVESGPRTDITKSFHRLASALTEDSQASKEQSFLASYLGAIRQTWARQWPARAGVR
jgi:pilus assembly protein CpaE